MEEEILEELCASLFLSGEEWEEETYTGNAHRHPYSLLIGSHRRSPSSNSPVGVTDDCGFYPVYWFLPANSSVLRGAVRGQEVPITPEAINSLYWDEPIQPNSAFYRK
ncbi:hypothetical protein HAX54_043322, partial [Datura stramonium]|nr:hypothetical protein [Datura stramonium]